MPWADASTFAEATRTLLLTLCKQTDSPPLTFAQIARATGLKRNWLTRFAKNKIPDPSVHRVQTLQDYLASVQ
jgi:transcriptional regulator with XRE-family HTH domain